MAWLAFFGWMLYARDWPSELNEWGDAFAGFFAPLAFLWLVLGYLQQGEELRGSREALLLQANELKNSVAHQGDLVKATREQINFSKQQVQEEQRALASERERLREKARPRFVISEKDSSGSGPYTNFNVLLRNIGATATQIEITFKPSLVHVPEKISIPALLFNETLSMVMTFSAAEESVATIAYMDAEHELGSAEFTVLGQKQSLKFSEVHRIE